MTYLIVGLDRRTLAPWHRNILERDAASATCAALAHARTDGIDLVVAALVGPNSTVIDETYAHRSTRLLNAA
jgi:hypothetical protein